MTVQMVASMLYNVCHFQTRMFTHVYTYHIPERVIVYKYYFPERVKEFALVEAGNTIRQET